MDKRARKRIIWSVFAAAFVLASLIAIILSISSEESNRLQRASDQRAVASALNDRVVQLSKIADDNAFWDEAALNAYKKPDMSFMQSAWGAPITYNSVYDELAIIDADENLLIAFSDGQQSTGTKVSVQSPDFATLLKSTQKSGRAAGGVVATPSGTRIMAIAQILPTSPALQAVVPKAGPSILIATKALKAEDLAQIAEQTQLPNVALASAKGAAQSLALRSPAGTQLGYLTWPETKGASDIAATLLPWLIAIFLFTLGFITWLCVTSARRLINAEEEGRIDPCMGLSNIRSLEHQVADNRLNGLSIIVCRIEGDDQNLVRIASRRAYMLQTTPGRDARYRAWLENGVVTFAWAEAVDVEIMLAKVREFSSLLSDEISDLAGAGSLTFGLGIARQIDCNEPLIDISRRAARTALMALSQQSGAVLFFADRDDQLPDQDTATVQKLAAAGDEKMREVRYSPILCPHTRRILSFEPIVPVTTQSGATESTRPWLDEKQNLELLRNNQFDLINHVMATAAKWQGINIAIKISAIIACHPRFVVWLMDTAEAHSFPLARLELIIITSTARENMRTKSVMERLEQFGVIVGLELHDATLSMLQAVAANPAAFLCVSPNKAQPELVDSQTLAAAAKALAIPLFVCNVTTHKDHEFAQSIQAKRVEGRFYLSAAESGQISRLIDNQNNDLKRDRLRLAS